MKINVTSVYVDDQDRALRFYTDVLGFVKKAEIPLGEACWLTVVSPNELEGTELLLEPDAHSAVKPFKQALVEDGIPFTSFAVDDVRPPSARRRDAAHGRFPPGERDGRAALCNQELTGGALEDLRAPPVEVVVEAPAARAMAPEVSS